MSVISRSVSEIFVSMAGGEREFGCTVVDCMSLRGVKCLENVKYSSLFAALALHCRNPHGILTAPYPAFIMSQSIFLTCRSQTSFLSPEVRSRAMCSAENLQVSLPRGCFSTPSDTFGWGVTPDFRLGVTYAAHPLSPADGRKSFLHRTCMSFDS